MLYGILLVNRKAKNDSRFTSDKRDKMQYSMGQCDGVTSKSHCW